MAGKNVYIVLLLSFLVYIAGCNSADNVTFTRSNNQIEVRHDTRLVTSYIYGDQLAKPFLFPVMSPSGIMVNRGFPVVKDIKGESTDHLHHTGLFFAYDQVNKNDFWENSAPPPQIKHVKVLKMDDNELVTLIHWVNNVGTSILAETRKMSFTVSQKQYVIDFDIELEAMTKNVGFGDTKEGLFAIRVADWLREDKGNATYLSSENVETAGVIWGKRAKWVRLEGQKDGKTLGIAMLNHPESINYPTFWMVRSYGLFSANPLGQYYFQSFLKVADAERFGLVLAPGENAEFKFRVIVYEGQMDFKQMQKAFERYAGN